jgi:hypothetical protein
VPDIGDSGRFAVLSDDEIARRQREEELAWTQHKAQRPEEDRPYAPPPRTNGSHEPASAALEPAAPQNEQHRFDLQPATADAQVQPEAQPEVRPEVQPEVLPEAAPVTLVAGAEIPAEEPPRNV